MKHESNRKAFINSAAAYLNQDILLKTGEKEYSLPHIYPYITVQERKLEQLEDPIGDCFGVFYEANTTVKNRKDFGQFYTRDHNIINEMLDAVDLFSGKILEPACGTGCFLVAIVRRIITKFQADGKSAADILTYVAENIYANDCDVIATKITEINLLKTLLPLMLEAKNENPEFVMPKLKLFNYDFTKKNSFNETFSLIIGNPPFVTMYGKRSRNMTEEKRAYYNTFDFVQNKKGNNKFNLSMFFIENGLKLLQNEGQLCFIMDLSFFETAFIDMRRYLVKNYFINCIMTGLQEFENVASGQAIIHIINKKEYNDAVKIIDYETKKTKTIHQKKWDNKDNKYKFFVPLDPVSSEINAKLERWKMLDFYFPKKSLRTCCALTGKTDEFIVDPKKEKEHIVFPYIEGSKGLKGKFSLPTATKYIKYDYDLQIKLSDAFKVELEALGVKNKKRVTLGDKEAYLSPKIFIRQSASEIIATYCEKPLAANNSIYILTTKSRDKESTDMLKYTCGLLNSDLITFYCRINRIIRIDKGKTPQIKISDLKNIRINIDKIYFRTVITLVEELLQNPDNRESLHKLNLIIYKIYSITEQEQQYITDYLSAQ